MPAPSGQDGGAVVHGPALPGPRPIPGGGPTLGAGTVGIDHRQPVMQVRPPSVTRICRSMAWPQ